MLVGVLLAAQANHPSNVSRVIISRRVDCFDFHPTSRYIGNVNSICAKDNLANMGEAKLL
jgi:hypothetical protein